MPPTAWAGDVREWRILPKHFGPLRAPESTVEEPGAAPSCQTRPLSGEGGRSSLTPSAPNTSFKN
eukprot:15472980-Alexandrium_andersonii.AAC.1